MILNHFSLIPVKAEACSSVTLRVHWEKTENPVCFWVCVKSLLYTHTRAYWKLYAHILSVIRKKKWSSCLSPQMLICYPLSPLPHTAGGNSWHRHPLSPLCLSLSHARHEKVHWQLSPFSVFPLTRPSLFSPHRWDEKWLSFIISKTDSPTDLLSAFKPLSAGVYGKD